jgi:hypothetical protein
MLFSSTRAGHLLQLVTSSVAAEAAISQLTPPDPAQVQQIGSLILQAAVAVVTIWATIRKALQKPEKVIQVVQEPAAVVR